MPSGQRRVHSVMMITANWMNLAFFERHPKDGQRHQGLNV